MMINLNSIIDLKKLPSVPLTERLSLPKISAVYFVLKGSSVLYIGQSANLFRRWQNHVLVKQLTASSIRIAWLKCSKSKLLSTETILISKFVPKLNKAVQIIDYSQPIDFRVALDRTIKVFGLKAADIAKNSGVINVHELSKYRRGHKDIASKTFFKLVEAMPLNAKLYFTHLCVFGEETKVEDA
ncbi:MAG: GIY-YIG nuclease family protein [Chroococcidiopsis sp.]